MKLNTKKLYMADGHSVKELLKLSTLLHTAMTTHQAEVSPNMCTLCIYIYTMRLTKQVHI